MRDRKRHNDQQLGPDGGKLLSGRNLEPKPGAPPLGIGRHCHIEGAMLEKNARIGEGVVITPNGKPANMDAENYCIRDGVVVVTKGAVIPSGTTI